MTALLACAPDAPPYDRRDDATAIAVDVEGSRQNPCWSPDGTILLLTVWTAGYNAGSARIAQVAATGGEPALLTADGLVSVNLPGACWVGETATWSSDAPDRDEVYVVSMLSGDSVQVTDRPGLVAYEPTLSPDGAWIAFESHEDRDSSPGTIWKVRADGTDLVQLSDGPDDREPNWSPAGDRIVFQREADGDWDLWTMDIEGGDALDVTDAPSSEDTDPSWSPDGARIVYSSDGGELEFANLFVIDAAGGEAVRATEAGGYDGAPSWSPDGTTLAFEAAEGDPDEVGETSLWTVPAP